MTRIFPNAIFLALMLPMLVIWATACSGDSMQEFPCVLKGHDGWGFVSVGGEVRDDNQWVRRPTLPFCGRFWVRNENGYWELFSMGEDASRIGNREYRYVTNFYEDRALVVERDSNVSVIDRNGDMLHSFERIGSVVPDEFLDVVDGLAVFSTDTLQGVVDFDGNVIVPPKHFIVNSPAFGRIIAYDRDFETLSDSSRATGPVAEAFVYDYSGNIRFVVNSNAYCRLAEQFIGNYLPVARIDGGKEAWGLLSENGEEVVEPDVENCSIEDIAGDCYVFRSSDGMCGVRSIEDGKMILAPKYASARFLDSSHLVVGELQPKDGNIQKYYLVRLNGEKVVQRGFMQVSPLFDSHVFVQVDDLCWAIIGLDGKMRERMPEIEDVCFSKSQPSVNITSDCIDIGNLIAGLNMSDVGVCGIAFQSSASQAIERQSFYGMSAIRPLPEYYMNTNEVNLFPAIEGEMVSVTVSFPSNLGHPAYRRQNVLDYVWGSFHPRETAPVPSGYAFTEEKPLKFTVTFNNYGKLHGKLRRVYDALVMRFRNYGNPTAANTSATLFELNNGHSARIALDGHSVEVVWGELSFDDKSIFGYNGKAERLLDESSEGTMSHS